MTLFLPKRLPNFLQLVGAIFRLFPDVLADKYRCLGLGRKNDAVARSRVDLNEFRVNFVLRPKDDPGEVGVAAQGIDDDALDLDVERVENKPN